MEEAEKRGQQREPTALSKRFSGFAAYHFILALLVDGIFWAMVVFREALAALLIRLLVIFGEPFAAVLYEIEDIFPWLLAAFAMGIYFPAGMIAAKRRGWTCPKDSDELCLAVLQPAAVAWGWAALMIFEVCVSNTGFLFLVLFVVSIFLATPSSIFVLCFFDFWMTAGSSLDIAMRLTFIGLFAGFLPPLLFALGSFWQSARMERRRVKPMERDTQY